MGIMGNMGLMGAEIKKITPSYFPFFRGVKIASRNNLKIPMDKRRMAMACLVVSKTNREIMNFSSEVFSRAIIIR